MSRKQSKSESRAELASLEAGDATPGALVGSPIQEAGRRKRRHKPAAPLAIDLPVGNSSPEFWGRSPSHSQAELQYIEDEDARERAQVGSSPAPHSPIGIINDKRAARQLAKQAHRRTEERRSRSESALRRKAKLKAESAMFVEMQEGAEDVRASTGSSGTEAG